ncbi:MAG: nitrite/sulfite reductase, partial [Gammaproteobacteria bacterium]|nr:nitrite/sulfite reductase [Gammaproteobacteria bacterium]
NIDRVQITTRQDIQFHYVELDKTADQQRDLARFGIVTREAGGNTVRNITSCQLAGVCPAENVDVEPYIQLTAAHFVRHPLTQSLPRKFKISFSGCAQDCAQGMVQDLGVIATQNNGQPGFRLLVGGGLGAKPKTAFELAEFIPEADLLPAVEALLVLHDRHSDRQRRTRNRIKFLVEQWGEAGFSQRFWKEFKHTRDAFTPRSGTLVKWRTPSHSDRPWGEELQRPLPQRQAGLLTLSISVPGGHLKARQLEGLATLLEHNPRFELRANQDQNLTLFNVPTAHLQQVTTELAGIDLNLHEAGKRVAACPGTSTCPLGVTNSQRVAFALNGGAEDLSIRINGCQNGCANSLTADIGFAGVGKRHHGKLIPSYRLELGGKGRLGGAIAFDGPEIPAVRLTSALERIKESYQNEKRSGESFFNWSRGKGADFFRELLLDLTEVRESELPFLNRDLGDSQVFKVDSVGIGECAGAKADPLDKLLLDARYEAQLGRSFASRFKYDEAVESLHNQLQFSTRVLLTRLDAEPDPDITDSVSHYLTAHDQKATHFGIDLSGLLQRIAAFKDNPDEQGYPELADIADRWENSIKQLNSESERGSARSGTDGY